MRTRRYQIIVSGRLGTVGREAFRDFHIEPHGPDTALTGDLTRSGLHDALTRIRDLALELVGFYLPGSRAGHQTPLSAAACCASLISRLRPRFGLEELSEASTSGFAARGARICALIPGRAVGEGPGSAGKLTAAAPGPWGWDDLD